MFLALLRLLRRLVAHSGRKGCSPWVVGLSRVLLWFAVWVVGFDVGDVVNFRGVCSSNTFLGFCLRLDDNPQHSCVALSVVSASFPLSSSIFLWRNEEMASRVRRRVSACPSVAILVMSALVRGS